MTRTNSLQALDWRDALSEAGPRYLQVVRFLERAIADGRLRAGDRLPAQRDLAALLNIDLTTVTRAYAEARARHLLHASGSKGSFVSAPRFDTAQLLDLGMNLPPPPEGVDMRELLRRGFDQVLTHADPHALMSYHPSGGSLADRRAGVTWLEPAMGPLPAQRIAIAPGAQVALAALILALTGEGEKIAAEPLVYPGVIRAAAQLGRHIEVIAADADGMLPAALEDAATRGLKLLYLNPTLRNPCATTMSAGRRDALVAVARDHDLRIIEDDPYWRLAGAAPAPLARRAPERTWYVSTLSKILTPGLRTAYVVAPDAREHIRFTATLSALALMATPLLTSVATQWIHDGTALRIARGVRTEVAARQRLAAGTLELDGPDPAEGIHLWLPLPPHWTAQSLTLAARREGLAVSPADAFSPEAIAAEAIRVSLGGPTDRTSLAQALGRLRHLLRDEASARHRDVV